MKRFVARSSLVAILVGLGVATVSPSAAAAPSPGNRISGRGGNLGLGASLGDPMGLSLKYFLAPNHAIQAHLAWLPLHHGGGGLMADYLWHPGLFVSNSVVDFMPYLGVGVGIGFWANRASYGTHGNEGSGQVGLIVRPPVGLALHWRQVPLDTVLEGTWSPFLIVGPPARVDLAHGDVSVKVRYYF